MTEESRPGLPNMPPEIFIRPMRVEDGFMVGAMWCLTRRRPVEVRLELPPNVSPETAMEAAREGKLVLPAGGARLRWSRA